MPYLHLVLVLFTKNMKNKNTRYLILILIYSIISCNSASERIPKVEIFDKLFLPGHDRLIGSTFNGMRVGLWTTIDSAGKIETEETYVNGRIFGVTKVYSDGVLFSEIHDSLKDSDTISTYEEYGLKDIVVTRGQYTNRLKSGIWLFFFRDGKELKLKVFYNRSKPRILYKSPRFHEDLHNLL